MDQVTTRICFEYFSEGFHKEMIEDTWMQGFLGRYPGNCTIWGITWGIYASWWVGAILGVLLAATSTIGSWPRLSARKCTALIIACLLLTALSVASLAFYGSSYFLEALDRKDLISMCRGYGFEVAPTSGELSKTSERICRGYLFCGHIHNFAYLFGGLYGVGVVAFSLGWRMYLRYLQQA